MTSRTGVASRAADVEEPAREAALMVGRCHATGLDVASYAGLVGCAMTLAGDTVEATVAWSTDHEFMTAVVDLQEELARRLARIEQVTAATREAGDAALAADDRRAIADCSAALEILARASKRVGHAARRLAAVPGQLGERYEAVYALVASGRVLPYNGRWITGAER